MVPPRAVTETTLLVGTQPQQRDDGEAADSVMTRRTEVKEGG